MAHRARLTSDLIASPLNLMSTPRGYNKIGNESHYSETAIKERSTNVVVIIKNSPEVQTGKQKPNNVSEEQICEYERGRNEQIRENREYLRRLFHAESDNGRKPKRR